MNPLGINFAAIRFDAPVYLALLAVPAILLALWLRQFLLRRRDTRQFRRRRLVPIKIRLGLTRATRPARSRATCRNRVSSPHSARRCCARVVA